MVGPMLAEPSRIISHYELGEVVEPGNPESARQIESAIRRFASGSEPLTEMGERARLLWETTYSGKQQLDLWSKLIEKTLAS